MIGRRHRKTVAATSNGLDQLSVSRRLAKSAPNLTDVLVETSLPIDVSLAPQSAPELGTCHEPASSLDYGLQGASRLRSQGNQLTLVTELARGEVEAVGVKEQSTRVAIVMSALV